MWAIIVSAKWLVGICRPKQNDPRQRGRMVGIKHRRLRIAWSVAWGVVAVLLVALWVRSYATLDSVTVPITGRFACTAISVDSHVDIEFWPTGPYSWFYSASPVERSYLRRSPRTDVLGFDAGIVSMPHASWIWIPHWFLVGLTFTISAAPWIE